MRLTLLSILLLSSFLVQAQKDTGLDFQNLFDSNTLEKGCYRIPAIITADNGDLITTIDERIGNCGDLKYNDNINIVIRRSSDNGKTWTDIERIVDYPKGESASDPSMILDKETGEIFLFFNYMNLTTEKDIYYLKVISSNDYGKTWSEPRDITSQITKPEWENDFKFITSGRGIQAENGDLIHSLVNLQNGLHLFKSKDHGKSWMLLDTPIKPGDESKVVQLNNGTLMVNSRVNGLGSRYVHLSKDGGQSWTSRREEQLIDPSCNASIIRYNMNGKNMLLFSNANSANSRENLTLKYSTDEGQTWSNGKTIYSGGSAYSSLTILQNGDIGLFFEKDGYRENVFVSFSLEWLMK